MKTEETAVKTAKPLPGPYELTLHAHDGWPCAIYDRNNEIIADFDDIDQDEISLEVCLATARLFTAAPTLKAQNEKLLEVLRKTGDYIGCIELASARALTAEIAAAIKQERGEG